MNARLSNWVIRDILIVGVLSAALAALDAWHGEAATWWTAVLTSLAGFITAYVTCYILHEWGHWAGAIASGASVRILPPSQPLLAGFDISAHSTRQFVWLSWGGVLGYAVVAASCLTLYALAPDRLGTAALAVGGLAFLVQSLAVDVPQIVRVLRGADPAEANRAGASPAVIVRRTWQTWSVLAIAIIGWSFLT